MNKKTIRRATFLFFLLAGSGLITSALLVKSGTKPKKKQKTSLNVSADENQWVEAELAKLSLEERIAQSFMVACWSNKGAAHLAETEALVRNQKIGGLIFFQGEKDNLSEAIRQMQSVAERP